MEVKLKSLYLHLYFIYIALYVIASCKSCLYAQPLTLFVFNVGEKHCYMFNVNKFICFVLFASMRPKSFATDPCNCVDFATQKLSCFRFTDFYVGRYTERYTYVAMKK